LLAAPIADISYATFYNWNRSRKIYSSLKKGNVAFTVEEDEFVDRPDVVDVLRGLLRPPAVYKCYDLVIGNHGTGKTTLIRKVAHDLDGVVYVEIPAKKNEVEFEKSFGLALEKALNWTPPKTSGSVLLLEKLFKREKDQPGEILPAAERLCLLTGWQK
jgi:hypothetical protein